MRCFDVIDTNNVVSKTTRGCGNVYLPFKYDKAVENITIVGAVDQTNNVGYINDLNLQCYVYSYSELINALNEVTVELMKSFLTEECIKKFAATSHDFLKHSIMNIWCFSD